MTKRPIITAAAGFIMLAIMIFGVRSFLLPAKTALVFLEHSEGVNWLPAPENTLFNDGVVDWAAYEPVQLAGRDLGAWHEVVLVSFDSSGAFESFLQRIDGEAALARFHLLEVQPWAPEFLCFVNWTIRRHADDSVDIGPRVSVDEAIPAPQYAQRWRDLFSGPYQDEIVMFNFQAYLDTPVDTGADIDEGYARYSEKATKVLGKLGGRISRSGDIETALVGADSRQYDGYTFVHYPTVNVFEQMFTAKDRVDARVHQVASLSSTESAGYWGKPYKKFRGRSK